MRERVWENSLDNGSGNMKWNLLETRDRCRGVEVWL